jgi:hypothetical protein
MSDGAAEALAEHLPSPNVDSALLPELVSHLRKNREELQQQWGHRIAEAQLLQRSRRVA